MLCNIILVFLILTIPKKSSITTVSNTYTYVICSVPLCSESLSVFLQIV